MTNNLITLLAIDRNYNIITLLSYHVKKSKIMSQILFNRVLLMMTELEHLALMEVSQERGYTVYLGNMNDNFLMMNLGKICPCDLVSLSLQDLIIARAVINQSVMKMLIIFSHVNNSMVQLRVAMIYWYEKLDRYVITQDFNGQIATLDSSEL